MLHRLRDKLHNTHHDNAGSIASPLGQQQEPLSHSLTAEGHPAVSDTLNAGSILTHLTFDTFYSPTYRQFRNPDANELGTIDTQHGYVVWPVSIAFWALADLALRTKSQPSQQKRDVQRKLMIASEAMEKHWSPEFSGYCAWVWFQGNRDVYYDDNAHAGNALVTAWEATGDRQFLKRAEQIVTGLISRGWDRGAGGGPGGVAWHIEKNKSRNACSTLSVAVLACRLALHGVQREYCTELARSCITFSERHLVAHEDGLVIDNIALNETNGAWEPDGKKYTYNTGFAIEAFMLWARLTGAREYAEKAEMMALKAVSPETALFDAVVPDLKQRMWWDSTFFAHHLVEALVLVVKYQPGSETASIITDFLMRMSAYCRAYLRDPRDGLYFRNLRMYRIGEAQTQRFNELFGTAQVLEADGEEREGSNEPVERRRLIKTMIGNAGMARVLLLISDLDHSLVTANSADMTSI